MRPLFLPLLLAVGAALLGGCSGADDARDAASSVAPAGPSTAATSPATSPTTSPTTSPATSPATDGAGDVPAACAPYTAMVAAIEDAARQSSDPEEVAAAIGPVMKRFAARVPDLPRPPGLSAESWAGVVAMAARIRRLPAHPTSADIEAVQQQLSPGQRRAVEAAAGWFRTSCGL